MADIAIKESAPAFQDYHPLIKNSVFNLANMYKIPEYVDELESQAYVIFCKALESFNPALASFSTHLTYKLMGLSTFARKLISIKKREFQIIDNPVFKYDNEYQTDYSVSSIKSYRLLKHNIRVENLWLEEDLNKNLEPSFDGLSKLAQELISFCQTLDMENIESCGSYKCRYIPMKFAEKKGISVNKSRQAWEELRKYWNQNRYRK